MENTILPKSFIENRIARKLTKLHAKIKETSKFAEALNKYIANCNVETEEINVIPNRI